MVTKDTINAKVYEPPKTKELTVEMKPLRKELNGKVPTKQQ
jgi:hypothetical protein